MATNLKKILVDIAFDERILMLCDPRKVFRHEELFGNITFFVLN